MKTFKSFRGANFTGRYGQTLKFQTMDADRKVIGPVLTGQVKRIFRQGKNTAVELYIPAKYCTHIYEAGDLYYLCGIDAQGDDGK